MQRIVAFRESRCEATKLHFGYVTLLELSVEDELSKRFGSGRQMEGFYYYASSPRWS